MAMLAHNPESGRLFGQGFLKLENAALLSPIAIGAVVAVFSIFNGAGIAYTAYQLLLFCLLCPLLFVIKYGDRYTATAMLVSFLKIYFISQIVCLLMMRAPDAGLMRPLNTEIAIAAGLVGGLAGVGAASLIFTALPPYKPLLRISLDPVTLKRLGYPVAVVGLGAQAIWTIFVGGLSGMQAGGGGQQVSGVALFAYLTPLSILAMCCFAGAALIETRGKRIVSREFLAVFCAYLVLIAPLATKAEPLKPVVAIAILAFSFKWRPPLRLVLAGLLAFVFVAEFLYPTVTLTRLRAAGEHRPTPVVFAETVVESISDPANLSYVKAYTARYDREVGQSFYGRSMGFLDRFTPLQTDKLVTAAEYTKPAGWREFGELARSLLPRTFGFKRDPAANQRRIEEALTRHRNSYGLVGWENLGFVGTGWLAGGAFMAGAYMFAFAFFSSLAAQATFGIKGGGVIWIPFVVAFMLIPADTSLGGVTGVVWGWIVLTVAMIGLRRVFLTRP